MAEAVQTEVGTADWEVSRLATALGAEVRGVDLAGADDAQIDAIRELLLEHLVLFFPDQHLSVDDHVAFGRHFGPLEGHPNLKNPFTDHPELFELAASQGGVADEWHTDITFQDEPALMSVLHMLRCPPTGGDTMWSSLYAAYDALSAPMKELCEGLTALHDAHPHDRADKMAIHPVVRVHPDTGRRALYVSEHFTRRIVEMNCRRVGGAARLPHALDRQPPLHGSLPLERRHRGDVGQPLHAAFRAERFRGREDHPARHGDGRQTGWAWGRPSGRRTCARAGRRP